MFLIELIFAIVCFPLIWAVYKEWDKKHGGKRKRRRRK